jgi:hypothetical protein
VNRQKKEKDMNADNETFNPMKADECRASNHQTTTVLRMVGTGLIILTMTACGGGRSGSGVAEIAEAINLTSGVARVSETADPGAQTSANAEAVGDTSSNETGNGDESREDDDSTNDNDSDNAGKDKDKDKDTGKGKGKGHGKGGNPDKKGHGMGGNPDKKGHGKGGVSG